MVTETTTTTTATTALQRPTIGAANNRAAQRHLAALRRAARDAQREVWELRGYRRMTSRMVRRLTDTAQATAQRYVGLDDADIASRTLQRIAVWVGRDDRDDTHADKVAAFLGDARRQVGLAQRIAHQVARNSATGRGSMPRLKVDDKDLQRRLRRKFRKASAGSPDAVAVAHIAPIDPNDESKPKAGELLTALRALERTASDDAPTFQRRYLTPVEREARARVMRFERVESAPDYSPMLDGFGNGVVSVGTAHPTGHIAPGVPHRDAPSMRRGTLLQALRQSGAPIDACNAVKVIADIVHSGDRMSWDRVRETIGYSGHRATLQRLVRQSVRTIENLERRDGYRYLPVTPMPDDASSVVVVRTGRMHGSNRDGIGRAVTFGYGNDAQWRVVATHRPECGPIRCADDCRALQLVTVRDDDTDDDTAPASNVGAVDPYASLRRRLWTMLWDRVDDDTAPDIVRAIIERDTYGPRPRVMRSLP